MIETKRKSLEICRDLWSWLADNPSKFKDEWPGWSVYGECMLECPCCEYVIKTLKNTCSKCILAGYAWESTCMNNNSPFILWQLAQRTIINSSVFTQDGLLARTKYATIIKNACIKALSELPEELPLQLNQSST